jgi:hypothetical protein
MAKTYTKVHKEEKAANAHEKKIIKRGGKVVKSKVTTGYKLEYHF